MEKQYLTRTEAAEMLGLKTQTLANWSWRGEGPPVVHLSQRCVRYHRATLLEWAQSHTTRPGELAASRPGAVFPSI